ncbi:MAG: GNAT family N-acetyltransferase [Candidatus Bathyarchaeota archaeon]|nr:GNAT family N-acetyltransferase [Candidatus Bathyarchaeota archaeon]
MATIKDYPDIIDFRNRHYKTRRKPEHGIWEYAMYEPDKTVFLLAYEMDEVVATAATMPIYMQVGTEISLSGKIEQLFVVPRYRGSALFITCYRRLRQISASRGMKFLWIFTPLKGLPNRMGARSFEDIQVLTRPGNMWVDIVSRLQWDTTIWGRVGSSAKAILKNAFAGHNRTVPYIHKQAGYEIKKELIDIDQIMRLYERLKSIHENVISIRYDQKYLDWRVRGHPLLKYDEYQVQQGGELRAYAFVTLSKGVAHISDILSEDKYATSLLLHTILADYIGKAGRFQLMGNRKDVLAQDLFEQLNHFGFSVDKKTSKLWNLGVIDLTGNAEKDFHDIGNWHVTGLWTEGFLY